MRTSPDTVTHTLTPEPFFLPFDGPLDLASTLLSGQAFRWREEDGWFLGVVFGNIVKMRQAPGGVEFACAPDDGDWLLPHLGGYLSLDANLEDIYGSITVDEHIGDAIDRYRGMRILRQEPWECLVSFICSSASNIPRITRNVETICSTFGRPLRLGEYDRCTFPTADELAGAGEEWLRRLGLGYRAAYLASTSRAIADGKVDLMSLRENSYDEALDALTSLDGVGDKVANCVLLFALDKPEAFPVDVWIDRALREWYVEGKDLSRAKMRLWAQERFGPFAGYANQYLFHDRRHQGNSRQSQ